MQIYWIFCFFLVICKCDSEECDYCRTVSKEFIEGFQRSSGNNYGGGNTLWEESNLGPYATSEARFNDIIDGLCQKNNKCHTFLESIEHHLEVWWLNNFKRDGDSPENIDEHLCVNVTKACCKYGFYGSSCEPCLPCSKFGGFCHGNGSRKGSGNCNCHTGYTGKRCNECNLNSHYILRNDDEIDIKCLPCHAACYGGCSGSSSRDCVNCTVGWTPIEQSGVLNCVDINECDSNPCEFKTQFCNNKPGSFECVSCNSACSGCTGPNADECINCSPGFQKGYSNKCEDINECNPDSNLCQGEGEYCKNLIGGYECGCKDDFIRVDGVCTRKIKDRAESNRKNQEKVLRNKQDVEKIIWTVPYAKEFLKYFSVLGAFTVFCWCTKTQPIITSFGVLALGVFVYKESLQLDLIFNRQK